MGDIKKNEGKLKYGELITIEQIGVGSRVCIDFVDILNSQEGVFIGNTGNGYILILSENRTTKTYPPRPFRINCGAIHQYILKDNKTIYLSELKPGSTLSIFSLQKIRNAAIGRVKIEKRNLIRVELKVDDTTISCTLQESDSVNILTEDGFEKSVVDLKIGDKILCLLDEPGRHLGNKIEEDIKEY